MTKWTPKQMLARYKAGFGRGEGDGYVPWLKPGDVPSRGVVHEFQGRKVDRIHLALSSLEYGAILAVQRLGHVTDIREQFPLWPLEETEAIAELLGVRHPTSPGGGHVVMTTDILITVDDAHASLEPITVKPESELNDRRVMEKFEIERLYWENRTAKLGIVTERELPEGLIKNLSWIDDYHEITSETLSPAAIDTLGDYLFGQLHSRPETALNAVCAETENRLGYGEGVCLGVVRHALSRKLWKVPMEREIDPGAPLPPPSRVMTMAAARAAGGQP